MDFKHRRNVVFYVKLIAVHTSLFNNDRPWKSQVRAVTLVIFVQVGPNKI